MSKLLNWVVGLIPQEYKIGVAIKKASYSVGKLAVALLMYGKMKSFVGDKLTPDQVQQIQAAAAAFSAAALTGIQDWAKLKWPNATWL